MAGTAPLQNHSYAPFHCDCFLRIRFRERRFGCRWRGSVAVEFRSMGSRIRSPLGSGHGHAVRVSHAADPGFVAVGGSHGLGTQRRLATRAAASAHIDRHGNSGWTRISLYRLFRFAIGRVVEPSGNMVAIYRRRWGFWRGRLEGRERWARPGFHAELFCARRNRACHRAKSQAQRGPHVSTPVEWRTDEAQSRDQCIGPYDWLLVGALNCSRLRGEVRPQS